MNDDALLRRLLDSVTGSSDPEKDEELERELSDRPEMLDEYRRLRSAWDELGRLPVHEAPEVSRARAERELKRVMKTGARHRRPSWLLTAGAAVLFFAGGLALGVWMRPAGPPVPSAGDPSLVENEEGARYVLLIRGGDPPEGPEAGVEAMTGWARELWSEERLVWAERLSSEASVRVGESSEPVSGLFVIRARDSQEAALLARQAPHLEWGGSVEVLPTGVAPEG